MFAVEVTYVGQVPQVKHFADRAQAQSSCSTEAEKLAEESNGSWHWLDQNMICVQEKSGDELVTYEMLGNA